MCSFSTFIRLAYKWALLSSVWQFGLPSRRILPEFGGASRHALTVGFVALMVFCIGQRVLPAFSGMRVLFSTKLMFLASALLSIGCFLRVGSEILAYQGLLSCAWSRLPVSAITELIAVTIFAINLTTTCLTKRIVQSYSIATQRR